MSSGGAGRGSGGAFIGGGGADTSGGTTGSGGADGGGDANDSGGAPGNGGAGGNAGSGGTSGSGGAKSTGGIGGAGGAKSTGGIGGAGGAACTLNACQGCGVLAAAPNSKCGTCGTYVCSADKTSVTCNDPGTTNSCPTWCTTHPAPAGVVAADYQCVDFDNGMPSASVWAPAMTGSGALSRSNARASSPSYSLSTSVNAGSSDSATLTFDDVGSTPIKSISVTAKLDPVSSVPVVPPSGDIPLLCLDSGGNRTCLYYTVNGTDPSGADGYTGLYIYWVYVGGAAVAGQCPLSVTNLTSNLWNTVELDATLATGAITVLINGTSVAASCLADFSNDTVAKITVGPSTNSSNAFGWVGYYDDIQVSVRR
jgi:hypothetical protein